MNLKPCDTYKERIEQYCGNELDERDSEILLEHTRQCEACRQYLDALRGQEDAITQWVESLEPTIQSGQAKTIERFRQAQSQSRHIVGAAGRFVWARYAAAACVLIAAGFLAGRGLRPSPDMAQLQRQWAAAVIPQMERQVTESVLHSLRTEVVGQYAKMEEALSGQIGSQLKVYAEQTVVRNDIQTYRLLTELIESIQQAQSQNQQWVLSAMTKLEQCRLEDQEKMRTQFATFAVYTDNELTRTQEQLKALATNTKN
jgi:hypothetical protein